MHEALTFTCVFRKWDRLLKEGNHDAMKEDETSLQII